MMVPGVRVLAWHCGERVAAKMSRAISRESGARVGRIARARGIVIGGPVEAIAPGQLMLL